MLDFDSIEMLYNRLGGIAKFHELPSFNPNSPDFSSSYILQLALSRLLYHVFSNILNLIRNVRTHIS